MKNNKIYLGIFLVVIWIAIALVLLIVNGRFDFQNQWFYLLFLFIPLFGIHYFFKSQDQPFVHSPGVSSFDSLPNSPLIYLRHSLHLFTMLGISAIIFALARPQSKSETQEVNKEGIDIVLSMDVSGSMQTRDFRPNRLESAKKVAANFVEGRQDDRFGVVVYEAEAYTLVPLTADQRVVIQAISEIETGLVADGTAIGMGLATAVNRLKDSDAVSKVIILLTDGVNNRGAINPIDAARIAESFDIRVYTIGVGTNNGERGGDFGQGFDEKTLKEISEKTGGKYFKADSEKKLKGIYKEIDELEKTKFNITQFSQYEEEFLVFGYFSLGFFVLSFVLKNTLFRGI